MRSIAIAISILSASTFTGAALAATPVAPQIAFPGAEGYGKFTVGGRGGAVYRITNLNDAGPGSLREAVEAEGSRTIVFALSGTIDLKSPLTISHPNITIAGQTAPGDGITLKSQPLVIAADEVILRYIRVRLGDETKADVDAISARYQKNLIIDHVSASWSIDEVMSIYHMQNVTVQWSIIAEGLYGSHHVKGAHGYGGIWGANYSSYHHNLLANNSSRNPRFAGGSGNTDFRNNVIYNWGYQSAYGGEAEHTSTDRYLFTNVNMVANYFKPGPATKPGEVAHRIIQPLRNKGFNYGRWHVADNVVEGSIEVTADNWNGGVQIADGPREVEQLKRTVAWPAMAITQQAADEAYRLVLERAGASRPNRDSVDLRLIGEVRNGAATFEGKAYKAKNEFVSTSGPSGMIDSQQDAGGWPALKTVPGPKDTDRDGMPDLWERAQGLNPANASDRNIVGADGFTKLEAYLNTLAE